MSAKMTDTPTHAMLYKVGGVEHFYCFATGPLDFNAAQGRARQEGLNVYALPYATYLRRNAVGSGVLMLAEEFAGIVWQDHTKSEKKYYDYKDVVLGSTFNFCCRFLP